MLNRHPVTNAPLPSGMEVELYGGACTESFSGPSVSAKLIGGLKYNENDFLKGETVSLPLSLLAAKLHLVAEGSEEWEAAKALLDECTEQAAAEAKQSADKQTTAALEAELASLDERKASAQARLDLLKNGKPKTAKKTARRGK